MAADLGGLSGRWAALKRAWMLWHLADQRLRFLYDAPPPNEWVSVDCETTGLDTRRDEIISIGAVRIVGDRVMTSASSGSPSSPNVCGIKP